MLSLVSIRLSFRVPISAPVSSSSLDFSNLYSCERKNMASESTERNYRTDEFDQQKNDKCKHSIMKKLRVFIPALSHSGFRPTSSE